MSKKRICVIGGGIGGIAVANKLLRLGYHVSLYEKNDYLGGLCSGYEENGYHVDACFHWLMGTKENTKIHKLWHELGGLNKKVKIYHSDTFLTISNKNETIHLYADIDKSEQEWIALSKIDEDNIRAFFKTVRSLKMLWDLSQAGKTNAKDLLMSFAQIKKVAEGSQYSRYFYANRFQNETIRLAIQYGLTGYNNALFLMIAYASFCAGDSGVPFGGAEEFTKRLYKKLLDLGCEIHLNTEVEEIVVEDNIAKGIMINKSFLPFDRVISSVDPNYTLKHLLKNKYDSRYYDKLNRSIGDNSVSSCFVSYLSADKKLLKKIAVPTLVDIPSTKIGKKEFKAMLVRPYHFDPYFDKNGESVVSVFFDQNQEDYNFYRKMNEKEYKSYKALISKTVQELLENKYPFLKGKTKLITSLTPIELHEVANSSYGALQAYSFTDKSGFYSFSGKLYKVANLYFASQWNRMIGGTPSALLSGNKVAKKMHRTFLNPMHQIRNIRIKIN